MIPDEVQRTIEFILKSQADAVIRAEDTDKRMKELAESTDRQIQETNRKVQELTASTNRFQQEMKEYIKILTPLLEIQSRRMDRLDGLA